MKRTVLLKILIYLLLAASLAQGIWRTCFRITFINIIYQQVRYSDYKLGYVLLSFFASAMLIGCAAFLRRKENSCNSVVSDKERIIALSPLLLFLVEAVFPPTFFSPIIFCIIIGLTIYRSISIFGLDISGEESSKKWKYFASGILVLLFIVFVCYGLYIQHVAWRSFYFTWTDWGLMLELVKNARDFRFGHSDYYGFNHFGVHFSPAMVIFYPLMLFKNVNILFLASSLLLYGGAIILYIYSRSVKLSRRISLSLALIYLFTPGIINANLSVCYGFHEIFIAYTAILATAYFRDKKKYIPLICLLIFSMLIKEAVLVFFASLGAIFILQKKYRDGLILFGASTILFFVIYFVVFPWLRDGESYMMLYRYEALGKKLPEILMSPFRKPEIFWGYFVRKSVFCYLLTLFIPFFILIGIRPLVCFSGAVILFFTCMQSNEWFINIKTWYQTLPLIGIYLCILWNCRDMNNGTIRHHWPDWLRYGLKDRSSTQLLSAAVISCAVCVICCWFFWGQSPLGKVFYPEMKDDYRQAMTRMASLIPDNAVITVTNRTATHLFFRKLNFRLSEDKLTDYVIFDPLDPGVNEFFENLTLRDRLLQNGKYFPVAIEKSPKSLLMLFSRDKKAKRMPLPRLFNAEQIGWEKLRIALPVHDENFELRLKFIKYRGRLQVLFFIMLRKKINYDARFEINLSDGKNNRYWTFFAGDALLPTWSWEPRQIFCFGTVLPVNFTPTKGFCKTEKCERKK